MKKLPYFNFACALLLCMAVTEQMLTQTITFEKRIYITGRETAKDVQPTSDGGCIVAGAQCPGGKCDFLLVKTDENGDTLWTRIYGTRQDHEVAEAVLETNGGYLIVGWHEDSVTSDDMGKAIKTDYEGNIVWEKLYHHRRVMFPLEVMEKNGMYILGGRSSGDPFLMMISDAGDSLWLKAIPDLPEQPFSGSDMDAFHHTARGGFICMGATYELDREFVWTYPLLFETDSVGNLLWANKYPRVRYVPGIFDVQSTADGGFIASGAFIDTTDLNKVKGLLKIDSAGNTVWLKGWFGIQSVRQLSDGGFVFASFSTLAGTNSNGGILWGRTFPASDYGSVVRPTPDGGYVVTAPASGDIYLLKTDANGIVTNIRDNRTENPTSFVLKQAYPSPFNPSTTIEFELPTSEHVTLRIYNTLGEEVRVVVDEFKSAGSYAVQVDMNGLPSGVYLYRLQAGEFSEVKRMVLIR